MVCIIYRSFGYDIFDRGGNVRKLNNISDYVSTGSSGTWERDSRAKKGHKVKAACIRPRK